MSGRDLSLYYKITIVIRNFLVYSTIQCMQYHSNNTSKFGVYPFFSESDKFD